MRVELEGKIRGYALVHQGRWRHHHGNPVNQLPALFLRPRFDEREELLDAELAVLPNREWRVHLGTCLLRVRNMGLTAVMGNATYSAATFGA